MRRIIFGVRHRPAPVLGTLFSLALTAAIITLTASVTGTGLGFAAPAQRLAAATVVVVGTPTVAVTSDRGSNAQTDVDDLTSYRRVPLAMVSRLAVLPGAAAAIPMVLIPLALSLPGGRVVTGSASGPLTGEGWGSAALAPFVLREGRAPQRGEMVVGAGVAQRDGIVLGEQVRLAGEALPPFTVSGIASSPAGNPAGESTVLLPDATASLLYAHPGEADLIGLIAAPGVHASVLAARARAALSGSGLRVEVLTGAKRGSAEDLLAAPDASAVSQAASSTYIDVVLIGLFVVASAVSLSIARRRRDIALVRAVGATPGQVRRSVMLEQVVLGALGGLAGLLPGTWLASKVVHGFVVHQLIPPGARAYDGPWLVLVAAGTGTVVAVLSGLLAARRAGRISPAAALAEARLERRLPHPVRLVLGLPVLGGGVVLSVVLVTRPLGAADRLNDALNLLLVLMAAVALAGQAVVVLAELALRWPLRLLAPLTGRLALGEVRVRARRAASATIAIALTVAFAGAVYVIDATVDHASSVESPQRLVASEFVSAPGPGLAPSVLGRIQTVHGVRAAIALTPTTVYLPGNDATVAEAVSPGPLGDVLALQVSAGTWRGFGPGDIALSALVASEVAGPDGTAGVHVGDEVTAYLADGTPYRARVSTIYDRSLGFADALVPASSGGGGHLGATTLGEVLVAGSRRVEPAVLRNELGGLVAAYPGLQVAGRNVVDAEAALLDGQTTWANDVLLALIAVLAGAALVNTLVVSTLERRDAFVLLGRVGATPRQLLAATAWQTLGVGLLGTILGAACAGVGVAVVAKALTGEWMPYLPWRPLAEIVVAVLGVTAGSVLVPTALLARRSAPAA